MLNKCKEWRILQKHARKIKKTGLKALFKDDPERFARFHLKHDGVLVDYSKNHVTQKTLDALIDLAHACDVKGWRTKMLNGEEINTTESRSARHTDLRRADPPQEVSDVHGRMYDFCEKNDFKYVVNIGIGGSDLGGKMAYRALSPFHKKGVQVHFVSNMDGANLGGVLEQIVPEQTLFIVASKSFGTPETIVNARSAKAWLKDQGTDDVSRHFLAITNNIDGAEAFGIDKHNIFPMWDWVGGRFSIWSAIGLPLCLGIGSENFREFLAGASSMDTHFMNAPLHENMPVMLALIGIWNRNFMGYPALCLAPYAQALEYFPAYMQQLDMESNGKSVDREGRALSYATGPIVFGEVGTNAQHAFFQLLHQGSEIIPCDFILMRESQHDLPGHHEKLLVNALAQAQAFMQGRENKDLLHHFDGGRPSNTIVLDALNPYGLGQLMALYEHKIFVQGVIWNINSFDQCGVELGKRLAQEIEDGSGVLDSSTQGLMRYLKLFDD